MSTYHRKYANTYFSWVVAFIISILLLAIGARGLANGVDGQFGAISSQNIVNAQDSGSNFITNSFIANLPQVIFSFLYVAYNSLLTSMCLAAEWSRFATGRKGLRVSHGPMLAQRSNYFLSIPYRFAVPLIAVSTILHWLVSQSLFVIAVEAYDSKMQRDPSQDVYACGYSSVAIISALGVAVVMFSCLIVISLRRLESAMPVTGSCSIAIAAACHPGYDPNLNLDMETVKDANGIISLSPREEEEMAVMTVQWGSTLVSGPVGHCSFTSGDVYPPEEGKEYQ